MKCQSGHSMRDMLAKFKAQAPPDVRLSSVKLEVCPICGQPVVKEGKDIEKNRLN